MTKLLSMQEAAEFLNISIDTLRRIQKKGEIAFSLIGGNWKISQNDLFEYYEKNKRKPVQTAGEKATKKRKMVPVIQRGAKPIGYNRNGAPYWV